MKRLSIAVVLVGLLGSACASRAASLGTAPTGPSSSPSESAGPSESPSPTTTRIVTPLPTVNRTMTFQVWLTKGGNLFATQRTEPFSPAIGRASLVAMLDGASDAERAAGVGTAVPSGTMLGALTISSGIARVDFSSEFRRSGETPFTPLQIGQVVYTIGQFSTVNQVVIQVNGAAIYEAPQTKDEYEHLLPAIVVYAPAIGGTVGNPVVVSGTADVFEATVSLRILDQNGNEIARTFTQATCGTGCRGDYSVSVSYTVDHEQPGTIEVYETSMKDGSALHVARVPVTLTT